MVMRLLNSFVSVLERGPIWEPEPGSNTAKLYECIAELLDYALAELERFLIDLEPSKAVNSIGDFEKNLKLPKCKAQPTLAARRADILSTLNQGGAFNVPAIQRIANLYDMGTVTVTKPSRYELDIDFASVPVKRAICGIAECGKTNLRLNEIEDGFECLINYIKPAWLKLNYTYGGQ